MQQQLTQAIEDLQQGKMVLLVDDHDRENEGDLVMAAEFASAEQINFMINQARGIVCLSMDQASMQRLDIPLMTQRNDSAQQTPFGVSIEAATGVTTGVSAADRARTIAVAVDPTSGPADVVMPGHVFPLQAQPDGVMTRRGHTEGSVDLMRLSGLQPMAVICEVMNEDGTMARPEDLRAYVQQHQLTTVSIADIIDYRQQHESFISEVASSTLPTEYGDFTAKVFVNRLDGKEHVALISPVTNPGSDPLVRLHSECLTGDVFGSKRCDCGAQLAQALSDIAEQGGALLYLRQEGRGIGLVNKIKAYALQEQGHDTVEANEELGFSVDCREYFYAAQMIRALGYEKIKLLTNNPKKVAALQQAGVAAVQRMPIRTRPTEHNHFYLMTKQLKMGHDLNMEVL